MSGNGKEMGIAQKLETASFKFWQTAFDLKEKSRTLHQDARRERRAGHDLNAEWDEFNSSGSKTLSVAYKVLGDKSAELHKPAEALADVQDTIRTSVAMVQTRTYALKSALEENREEELKKIDELLASLPDQPNLKSIITSPQLIALSERKKRLQNNYRETMTHLGLIPETNALIPQPVYLFGESRFQKQTRLSALISQQQKTQKAALEKHHLHPQIVRVTVQAAVLQGKETVKKKFNIPSKKTTREKILEKLRF